MVIKNSLWKLQYLWLHLKFCGADLHWMYLVLVCSLRHFWEARICYLPTQYCRDDVESATLAVTYWLRRMVAVL